MNCFDPALDPGTDLLISKSTIGFPEAFAVCGVQRMSSVEHPGRVEAKADAWLLKTGLLKLNFPATVSEMWIPGCATPNASRKSLT